MSVGINAVISQCMHCMNGFLDKTLQNVIVCAVCQQQPLPGNMNEMQVNGCEYLGGGGLALTWRKKWEELADGSVTVTYASSEDCETFMCAYLASSYPTKLEVRV